MLSAGAEFHEERKAASYANAVGRSGGGTRLTGLQQRSRCLHVLISAEDLEFTSRVLELVDTAGCSVDGLWPT